MGEDIFINPIREEDDRSCLVPELFGQFLRSKRNITLVIFNLKIPLYHIDRFIEDLPSD
jgi:hypothetical protein